MILIDKQFLASIFLKVLAVGFVVFVIVGLIAQSLVAGLYGFICFLWGAWWVYYLTDREVGGEESTTPRLKPGA